MWYLTWIAIHDGFLRLFTVDCEINEMLFVFLIYYKLARTNPAKYHFSAYTYYYTVIQNLKYIRRFEFLLQNAIFRLVPRMTTNIDIAICGNTQIDDTLFVFVAWTSKFKIFYKISNDVFWFAWYRLDYLSRNCWKNI